MPKRRMTAARILQIKQFQIAGAKAASGPGSLAWAKSSILIRRGEASAAKARIVRLYQPRTANMIGDLYSNHGAKQARSAYLAFLKSQKIGR